MRLIDADAAIEALKRAEALSRAFGYHAVIDAVEALPTVDAVPVVRCKDCRCWQKSSLFSGHMVCRYVVDCSVVRREDDFCSRGESKE